MRKAPRPVVMIARSNPKNHKKAARQIRYFAFLDEFCSPFAHLR
jgi:hypothetical protein